MITALMMIGVSILGLAFAIRLYERILARPDGTDSMREIAKLIEETIISGIIKPYPPVISAIKKIAVKGA